MGKVAVKKFWTTCRDLINNERLPSVATSVVGEAAIPPADDLNIASLWQVRYHFVLPDAQMLIRRCLYGWQRR